jgi:hypothetical protein
MKKKRLAVKFFSVMMVCCVMVGVSAGYFFVPQNLVQKLVV